MEDMIKRLENQNSEIYKAQKASTLLNTKEFQKGRKMILIAIENDLFPLPKQYLSGMNDWGEDDIDSSQFCLKNLTLYFHNFSVKKRLKKKKKKIL